MQNFELGKFRNGKISNWEFRTGKISKWENFELGISNWEFRIGKISNWHGLILYKSQFLCSPFPLYLILAIQATQHNIKYLILTQLNRTK